MAAAADRLLQTLHEAEDSDSSLRNVQRVLRKTRYGIKRGRPVTWHQEAQLHVALGQYLEGFYFPHGTTITSDSVETVRELATLMFELLEKKLYPWIPNLHNNSLTWKRGLKGRGLVTCVPEKYFDVAITTIRGLRKILKDDLPIHVYYANDGDLPLPNREQLEGITMVSTHQLSSIFSVHLHGFQLKPFAILASGFAEVLWFDADLVFLVQPDTIFESPSYQQTGTLFFHDRTLVGWELPDVGARIVWTWVHGVIGPGSNYLRSSHAYAGESSNLMDSSALLMHVGRHLMPMLVVAQLNLDPKTYENVYGDKETFWLGFELLEMPWSMNAWGMSGVTFEDPAQADCTGTQPQEGKAQQAHFRACGLMGPHNMVQMIHFSESKYIGPAPFTTKPIGYLPALERQWNATCVRYANEELKEFNSKQLIIFESYMELYVVQQGA